MKNIEKRGGTLGVETRAGDEKRTLVGYAAVFDVSADIGGWWIERIAPGAFAEAIAGDVRALVDHDAGRVIGRTKSGTLRLSEDSRGLAVEVDVPDTTDGNDLWTLVERGDISGMSFGFAVKHDEWDETGEMPIRTIHKVELYEVSAVAWPAYDDTELGKRSLQEWRDARSGNEENRDPAAAPVSRAGHRARLKMDLDLRVRSTR
ncbi:HK97 family phage prohead protease [Sinorhizobium medicae]|uniref:HK97 family phage prohead protease n=1 Tax=Sinorhizobium medicae TaxID=110321 RepID=UPI00119D15D6|nr:HK97 family phage prohead protease [Sinorhizobium medicae]MDX0512561.1 HK97 family phage prohead protease [Sinorhizobium medicae]MDX0870567.1 HK97 family phage prohead protease [Sinorhizobium medicae]MDX0925360.1 HK97 family phage prohead protease [Sinorhizobium medicae]MDX0937287.1 HK97 family phage prohead protease [Sinorhizobium medicae]MDX0943551.1 HK97 family phage prohead protease [Sinorhizobium medicae]